MSYADLPVFKGPNGYPPKRMEEIFAGIKGFPGSCSFVTFYPRLGPWCDYLNELNKDERENYVFNATNELSEKPYDAYLIDLPSLAYTLHTFMMLTFPVLLIGIIGYILCIPWLNACANRTGATLYMTVAALFDILHLTLFFIVHVVHMFAPHIDGQIKMYIKWTSKIVPSCVPLMEYSGLMSTWLLVALLIDRLPVAAQTISPQVELQLDAATKAAVYRRRSRFRYAIYVFLMIVFFALYTLPKFFEFTRITSHETGNIKLTAVLVHFKPYRIVMINVLKPILEILLPSILVIWYLILIKDKKHRLKHHNKHQIGDVFAKCAYRRSLSHQASCNDCCITHSNSSNANATLKMSHFDCKRWQNESVVSSMAINIAHVYLLNFFIQAMSYFVRVDSKAKRELYEIFFYCGLIISVVVISMKPVIYLITSKSVLREFKEIQRKTASARHASSASRLRSQHSISESKSILA